MGIHRFEEAAQGDHELQTVADAIIADLERMGLSNTHTAKARLLERHGTNERYGDDRNRKPMKEMSGYGDHNGYKRRAVFRTARSNE